MNTTLSTSKSAPPGSRDGRATTRRGETTGDGAGDGMTHSGPRARTAATWPDARTPFVPGQGHPPAGKPGQRDRAGGPSTAIGVARASVISPF